MLNCFHNKLLSADNEYYGFMIINCVKTCGKCGEDTLRHSEETVAEGWSA